MSEIVVLGSIVELTTDVYDPSIKGYNNGFRSGDRCEVVYIDNVNRTKKLYKLRSLITDHTDWVIRAEFKVI